MQIRQNREKYLGLFDMSAVDYAKLDLLMDSPDKILVAEVKFN